MPINDYIIETLNVNYDEIEKIHIIRKNDKFLTYLTLKPTYPTCQYVDTKLN